MVCDLVQLVLVSSPSRGNELSLFYHKSESDVGKEPLGEIVLNEIKSVTLRKDKGEGRFDVEVPTRVFALKCDQVRTAAGHTNSGAKRGSPGVGRGPVGHRINECNAR